jgi:hypothetical protein
MNTRNLTDYQKDQLLDFFAYNMTMEARHRLMTELPMAYNYWAETEVVQVCRTDADKTALEFVPNKCEQMRKLEG